MKKAKAVEENAEMGAASAVLVSEEEKTEKKPKKAKKEKTAEVAPATDLSVPEIEEKVAELFNQGHSASEIGMMLREQFNVPKTKLVAGKTISQILSEKKLLPEIPEDLLSLIKRSVALDLHLQKNKKDYSAKRGFQLTVSKIRRLVVYYHANNRLPKKWRYSIETARLLVK